MSAQDAPLGSSAKRERYERPRVARTEPILILALRHARLLRLAALQPGGDALRRALALGRAVDDLLASIRAIPAREIHRIRRLTRGPVHVHAPLVEPQTRDRAEQL